MKMKPSLINHSKGLQRFFAGVTTVVFLVTSVTVPLPVAHAANVELQRPVTTLQIPSEFGRITESFQGPSGTPLLIHIKEAHANYDAQKNIQNILELLVREHGVRKIYLEGAGYRLTPGLFNFFPEDPGLQAAALEKLMQDGELTGAEVFLLDHRLQTEDYSPNTNQSQSKEAKSQDRPQTAGLGLKAGFGLQSQVSGLRSDGGAVEAWGVEKAATYAKNRQSFVRVFKSRRVADDFLASSLRAWDKEASRALNKRLKDFLLQEVSFDEKKLPMADWLDLLGAEARNSLSVELSRIEEQAQWPALVRYFRLKGIGNWIDPKVCEKEKQAFLGDLQKRKVSEEMLREVELFFGRKDPHTLPPMQTRFVFEKLMDQLPENYSFELYPHVRLLIQQGILLSELQSETLLQEISALSGQIVDRLVKTEQDKKLVAALRELRLLKKLFYLELIREEYEALKSQIADSRWRIADEGVRALFQEAMGFYAGAVVRENGMMEKTLRLMKEHKQTKAVLITGGFHSNGFKEKAVHAGISYAEITPRIGEVSETSTQNYLETLLGRRAVQTSQISAPKIGDASFFKEIFPTWRRNLAERAARIKETLQSVPGITPSDVRQAISDFLQKAVSESEEDPFLARSEVRDQRDTFEVKDALRKIAEGRDDGLNWLAYKDVRDYRKKAQKHLDDFGLTPSLEQISSAKESLESFESYVQYIRDLPEQKRQWGSGNPVFLKEALDRIADATGLDRKFLGNRDIKEITQLARILVRSLTDRPSQMTVVAAAGLLASYQVYVESVREAAQKEAKARELKRALRRIVRGTAAGFSLLKPADIPNFREAAQTAIQFLESGVNALSISEAERILATYRGYVAALRPKSRSEVRVTPSLEGPSPADRNEIFSFGPADLKGFEALKPSQFLKEKGIALDSLRGGKVYLTLRRNDIEYAITLVDDPRLVVSGMIDHALMGGRALLVQEIRSIRAIRSESRILGTFPVKVDEKGRFSLPSAWRIHGEEYIAVIEPNQPKLRIYPKAAWEDMVREVLFGTSRNKQEVSDELNARSYPLKLDRQGRITLAEQLRTQKSFPVKNEYMLAGAGDSFLISPVATSETAPTTRSEMRGAMQDPWEGIASFEERTALRNLINEDIAKKGSVIYEVNSRQKLLEKRHANPAAASLWDAITNEDLKEIQESGANVLWLMGVWKTSQFSEQFNKGWEDPKSPGRVASAYSIDDYVLNPDLGDEAAFRRLVIRANRKGLKVILDFVPNHMAADSVWVQEHPEWFMQDPQDFAPAILNLTGYLLSGPAGFAATFLGRGLDLMPNFLVQVKNEIFRIAHARGGLEIDRGQNKVPWIDVAQINLSHPGLQEKYKQVLSDIFELTNDGGVRVDMAHYTLKEHINYAWLGPLGQKVMEKEFWRGATDELMAKHPGALFVAEAYGYSEGALQAVGISATYDKYLSDLLIKGEGSVPAIVTHLTHASIDYLRKTVHFLENHDDPREVRIANLMSREQHIAALAVISAAAPGSLLLYDGQLDGQSQGKPSANWLRSGAVVETDDPVLRERSRKILGLTKTALFRKGEVARPSAKEFATSGDVLVVQRRLGNAASLVIVNYGSEPGSMRYVPEASAWGLSEAETGQYEWVDLLAEEDGNTIPFGHHLELKPWESRILVLQRKGSPAQTGSALSEVNRSEAREEQKLALGVETVISGAIGAGVQIVDASIRRSESRIVDFGSQTIETDDLQTWLEANAPRVAKEHLYSRQWECGLPMDLLEKIAELYSKFEAGEISQATLTGGLGALLPDLFEAWGAIGMNVTGIHPLWNYIKNTPGMGYDQSGRRKLLADVMKQFMEKTDIEFERTLFIDGSPQTVFFRVFKTYSTIYRVPQYYLDAYTRNAEGKVEPFFQEVYDDHGKREKDMAFFAAASERLIQILESNDDPRNITLIDHEVFVSLPTHYLKKAKRVTLNHTVFRPGLFEAWEGHYDALNFPEGARSTIVHDGKISIADYTAETFHLISGVNLVEHLPALLKNIFRTAWHRVRGYYDREGQIRSTNGVFLDRWQSPSRRTLIERYKEELQTPKTGHKLPASVSDRQFFARMDQDEYREQRERFKDQDQWVVAGDVAELLIWLREHRGFSGAYDWLGNTFKDYQQQHSLNPDGLVAHLRDMQGLLAKAVAENRLEDWARLQSKFGEAYELLLNDPIAANVRRFVAYKGPDKYEEVLKELVAKVARQSGLKVDYTGKFSRPYEGLFSFWKDYHDGKNTDGERYQREFEALRDNLKDQPAVEKVRQTMSRLLVGGRTFDASEAHDRLRYIRFMTELLGLEDRIATLENHTYFEAQIIFRGAQVGVMLSDEDLEASATSMMKVKSNGGEVDGPFAGSNPEIWTIRSKKTGEIIEVLNEKGEPNTAVITQDILREKLRTGEWELLDGVFVAYNDAERSTQEGGGRRPSARSLLESLVTVKTLRADPAVRRDRHYNAVSSAWKVDVLSQAMAHAMMLEAMLEEHEERESLFQKLKFKESDYAVPMTAPDFGWKTRHPIERHSMKGLGLFGMFRSFRNFKTWQRKTPQKPDGDPSTRGMDALDSLKHHAFHNDIFDYLNKYVLDRLSAGTKDFKDKIAELEAQSRTASDRELVALNLQAMDLTEELLVRMAGDWLERYMQAGQEKAAMLRAELTQGVPEDYQPWAEYISRYLETHPDARPLPTRDRKIRSFLISSATPTGKKPKPMMINLNVGAPVHRESDDYFQGLKARTKVQIDEATFRILTGDAEEVRFIQLHEPKQGLRYGVRPAGELASEVGIGIPMPIGIEVIKWVVMRWFHLLPSLAPKENPQEPLPVEPFITDMKLTQALLGVAKQEPSAMDLLRQLVRESRKGYELPEGRESSDHFFEQLEVLASLDREMAVKFFGSNLKQLITFIGIFRPDLLQTSEISSWDPEFCAKVSKGLSTMQDAFGEAANSKHHQYYVLNNSHQGALILGRKDAHGDAFFIAIQFAANPLEAAEDGKVSTRISSESLTRLIDAGVFYRVHDLLAGEDYGERNDLLQGWTIRTPFTGNADRVQFLSLKNAASESRSETRATDQVESAKTQRSEMRAELEETDWTNNGVNIESLRRAGHPVGAITEAMDDREIYSTILSNQVIYLTPALDSNYDYVAYEERLIQMAVSKIGPALGTLRETEDAQKQTRQRKIFILRGMVDPGTSKRIYDTIKWNAHPKTGDDLDFDLVFQPDFTFRKSQSRELVESSVVFGLMSDTRPDLQKPTREILDQVFGAVDGKKEIQYINIRSAEMAKEMLLIYLGAKLAHFDDIAELSHAYGADLSAAAFGAGLDKRIRTLFTNPSLGFGGRLFTHLAWIYAQRLHKAATEMEGHTHQKIVSRRQQLDEKIQASVQRLDRGETMETILKDLPSPLHLLFLVRAILKINKQNILDFYNTIEREYEKLGYGQLLGKKVALLSVGYRSQGGNITSSPALLLIERLMMDHGVSEFFVADPAAQEAFQKWAVKKQQENPRYRSVRFTYAQSIYEAVKASDLTVIPTDSNKDLWTLDIQELGRAANGKPVFDGMNLFGLRADGSFNYKLEEVRKAGINLIGVGRLPLGPAFDHQTGDYRLGDSTVIRSLEDYQKAIRERGPVAKEEPVSFQQKTVTMVGGGYVGLVTAANLAALGHRVHVVDIKSKQKEIDALNSEETAVPIYEPGLRDMIIAGKKAGLITFSTDLEPAVKDSSIVYLAVGTPSQETGEVELSYILKASEDVGDVILKYGGSKALVIKSTVTPDTFQRMDQALKSKGLKLGKDYAPVSNPEFLREGQAIEDVTQPDRTVLGFYSSLGSEDRSRVEKEILELWYPLMVKHPHTVLMTDTASSTIIKYLANSFLAISITLSNIFAAMAENDSADFMEIRRLLMRDERIGKNAFLAPGAGYGGSCFPKDVLALHFSSKKSTGHELPLISVATGFNDFFKKEIVKKATQRIALHPRAQQPLEGKSFTLLGMAFKADTDDMREASSVSVLRELLLKGASRVELHDPILSMPNAPATEVVIDHFLDYLFKAYHKDADFQTSLKMANALRMAQGIPILLEDEYFKNHYFQEKFLRTGRVVFTRELEQLRPSDAVFLMTEWSQYKDIDLEKFKKPDGKLWVIDGRNLYYGRRQEISLFADYMGVGTTLFTARSEVREDRERLELGKADVSSKAQEKESVYAPDLRTWFQSGDMEETVKRLGTIIEVAAEAKTPLFFHASSRNVDDDAILTLLGFMRSRERHLPTGSVVFGLADLDALAHETGLDPALVRGIVLTQGEYDVLRSTKAGTQEVRHFLEKKNRSSRETLGLRKTLREIGAIGERFLSHWAVQGLRARGDALRAWDGEFKERLAQKMEKRKALLSDPNNFEKWAAEGSSKNRVERTPPMVVEQLRAVRESGHLDLTPYQTIADLETSLDARIRETLAGSSSQSPEALRESLEEILTDLSRWEFLVQSRALSYRDLRENSPRPEALLFFVKDLLVQQTVQDMMSAMANSQDRSLAEKAKATIEKEARVRMVWEVPVHRPEELARAHRALLQMKELIEVRQGFYSRHGNGAEGNITRLYGDMFRQIDQILDVGSPQEAMGEDPAKRVAQKWISHLQGKEFAGKALDFMNLFQKVWGSDEKGWWVTSLNDAARKDHMPSPVRERYRVLAKEILQLSHVGDGKEIDGLLYRSVYILPLLQRSEIRTEPNAVALGRFLRINSELGGGTLRGFERVTTELTDGIWSLVAHSVHAVDLVAALFDKTAARDAQGLDGSVLAEPKTLAQKARVATARRALGIPSTISAGDAFIIRPGLAFKDGALIVKKMVFGDAPVVIYDPKGETTSEERSLLQQINARLAQAQLPLIQVVKDLSQAKEFLKSEVEKGARQRSSGPVPSLHLKVMANVLDPMALLLKQQYKDDAVLMTSQRFKAFLELAGVATLVNRMQNEYLATSRSA